VTLFSDILDEFLKPPDYEFYRREDMPPEGWPDRESQKALRKSCDRVHDNMRVLVRENDRLRAAVIELRRRQRICWAISLAAAIGMFSVFGYLLPYALHGMAR
jgi:hypothetical protein